MNKLGIRKRFFPKISVDLWIILFFSFLILNQVPMTNSTSDFNNTQFQARTIYVGHTENRPVSYVEDGMSKGIFIDLIQHIADQQGWTIEFIADDFPNLVEKMNDNEIDLIAGLAYGEQRAEIYQFTNQTMFTNWAHLYSRADLEIQSILDLEGKSVATVSGSIHHVGEQGIVNLLNQFNVNSSIVEVNSFIEVLEVLNNGTVDVGVLNRFVAHLQASDYNVKRTDILFNPIELRYAINKTNQNNLFLIEEIDIVVKNLKQEPDSAYYTIIDKYFQIHPATSLFERWIVDLSIAIFVLMLFFFLISLISRIQVNRKTKELRLAHEQLLRDVKLKTLGQLTSSVAHELRNPLTVINNAIHLLKTELKDPDEMINKYLNILQRGGKRANYIITDMLDYAKTKLPNFIKSDFNHVIKSTLSELEVPEKIVIITNFDLKLNEFLFDPDQLRQVFHNLIINAFQAMPNGGTLTIESKSSEKRAKFVIQDTGMGISKENLTKIFEPLYTTKIKGIGLGLSIVKNLLENHNGQIHLESIEGMGTTITFTIPLKWEG